MFCVAMINPLRKCLRQREHHKNRGGLQSIAFNANWAIRVMVPEMCSKGETAEVSIFVHAQLNTVKVKEVTETMEQHQLMRCK